MTRLARLVHLCIDVSKATTPVEKMTAAYRLREFLVEEPTCLLHVDIEMFLHANETDLPDTGKDVMRSMGYQFPEDFDRPKEFLCE